MYIVFPCYILPMYSYLFSSLCIITATSVLISPNDCLKTDVAVTMNKNAEIAFNNDFSRMSTELPRIVKTKEVTFKNKDTGKMEVAYSYEAIVYIDEAVS